MKVDNGMVALEDVEKALRSLGKFLNTQWNDYADVYGGLKKKGNYEEAEKALAVSRAYGTAYEYLGLEFDAIWKEIYKWKPKTAEKGSVEENGL